MKPVMLSHVDNLGTFNQIPFDNFDFVYKRRNFHEENSRQELTVKRYILYQVSEFRLLFMFISKIQIVEVQKKKKKKEKEKRDAKDYC